MTEYFFYPCIRKDKVEPLIFDRDGDPAAVMERSRSFIDGDFFRSFEELGKDDLAESFVKHLKLEHETYSSCFYISKDDLDQNANGGLMTGYIPLEDIESFNSDPSEYLEDIGVISAEIYSGMTPKRQDDYVRVSAVNYIGKGFICSHLLRILNGLPYIEDETGYVMYVSY